MKKPVISVVGWHNAGKTTFIVRLVEELKRRGLRVATIKHSREDLRLDAVGTDTWRYTQAGSDVVAISGKGCFALFEYPVEEPDLETILARVPDYIDLVITEGFKRASTPKIEVVRSGIGEGPIASPEELLALVTDDRLSVNQKGAPQFAPEDVVGVVDLLFERKIIKSKNHKS